MRFIPVMLVLTMAPLCTKQSDDSGGDDSGPAVQTFAPEQGHWTTVSPTVVSDGCHFYDGADTADTGGAASGFVLAITSDTSFTVTTDPEEGSESKVTTCTLSDHDFVCEPFEIIRHDYTGQGYDGVIIVSQTVSGLFSDGLNLAATNSLGATCEGSECEEVSAATGIPIPCETLAENTASHDM